MIFDEFKICNSEYIISDKDSESAISSDGEFNDANRINVFDEDDSYINQIESTRNNIIRDNIYRGINGPKFAPIKLTHSNHESKYYSQDAVSSNESFAQPIRAPKTKRDKCLKFFTKVGYTKARFKAIPRWCTDMQLLDRMVIFQKKNPDKYSADVIFGKFDPRRLDLNMYELFGPPNSRNLKKQHRYNNRGSPGVWNDEKEFLTPIPIGNGKAHNPHLVQHEEVSSFDQGPSL